jgi:hypothetical protein
MALSIDAWDENMIVDAFPEKRQSCLLTRKDKIFIYNIAGVPLEASPLFTARFIRNGQAQ